MENIRGYNIRKAVKISGTNVRLFLRDNESTPVFSFADLVRAVFGEDNPGPIVLAKQIPEKNKANLIGRSGDSSIVVDFEGLSFFLVDKMEAKFAKTTIDYIREYLDKESHKLPSPVKVVSKSGIREEKIDEEFKRQYMVQTEDGRSQRYLKIRGFRWFNGVDIRSNYCGSSDEYFNSIVENLKDEYRFKTLMDEVGTVTFLSEQGLIELLKETTPDRYKSVYENILEQCLKNEKELSGEKEELVLESEWEEPEEKTKALELSDVYKLRKNLKDSIMVSDSDVRMFATPDYSFRLLNYNGKVFASVDDVQKSALNPENKEYEGSSTLKFASAENKDKYLGRFAKLYDVLNCFLDDEKLLEVLEKVKLFVSPPPIEKVEVKPKKEAGVKMNKYYTPDPIPGRVVAWTDLQMNVPVFTVFIEDKEGFVPLFKAGDVGNYAGFSNALALTRRYVNEKLYTKVSINEIHRNNMRMLSADGVHDLIVASGKFADKTVADTLTRDLKNAATEYLLENEKDIKFRIDKWDTEEAVKQEPAIEESPAKETKKKEKVAKEPTAKADKNEYASTVCINNKLVRTIIKRKSDRDIVPYYCVEDFCNAWGLDVNAVKSHISDGMATISKKDKDGSVIFVSYADMSAIATFENGEARTMVSNTMKASGVVFKEACASFGISFDNDTEHDERVGHYSDREKSESIDTRKPGSMEQLLSHSENGYAYTVGAIILAERIRNVLSYLKVCNSKIESGLPGPTSSNLVKKLWMYIDAQDPHAEAGTAFQQTVVAANERYNYLLDAAKSISKA